MLNMHGSDEIMPRDFNPDYYCGRCGSKMKSHESRFECPLCNMIHIESAFHLT